jgi:hypothetical protein
MIKPKPKSHNDNKKRMYEELKNAGNYKIISLIELKRINQYHAPE